MAGIQRGSYIVAIKRTSGGTQEYDICIIVGGSGILSDPWVARSLVDGTKYSVSAMMITRESYYENYNITDAELIYTMLTGNNPPKYAHIQHIDSIFDESYGP
ncbi:MAG: hypothetical protein QXU32_01935 [Nitrososphaerales archaeon]